MKNEKFEDKQFFCLYFSLRNTYRKKQVEKIFKNIGTNVASTTRVASFTAPLSKG